MHTPVHPSVHAGPSVLENKERQEARQTRKYIKAYKSSLEPVPKYEKCVDAKGDKRGVTARKG